MLITTILASAYVLVIMTVGLLARSRAGGVGEFFVAGRQLPWFLLAPFLASEFMGTMMTVGNAEMAHARGVSGLWYYLGTAAGLFIFVGLIEGIRSLKKMTTGEVFGALFDERVRLICVTILLLATPLALGAGYVALATVLAPLIGIPYNWASWLSMCLLVLMGVMGLRGVVWMNLVHFAVIVIGFAVGAAASISSVGGVHNLFASLPSEHLNWLRPGVPTITAWFSAPLLLRLTSVSAIMAIFAAKDTRSAQVSFLATAVFLIAFAILPLIIGLSAQVIMPDIPSRFALWEMGEHNGEVVLALLTISVIAAIMSTTPGILLGLGGLASRDVLLRIRPDASENAQVAFSRIIMLALGVFGTSFALTQPTIYGLITRLVQMQSILPVVLLVTLVWKRIHPTAAFWTILFGGTTAFTWLILGSPFNVEPMWPGLGIGVTAMVVVSLFRRPTPSGLAYRENIEVSE